MWHRLKPPDFIHPKVINSLPLQGEIIDGIVVTKLSNFKFKEECPLNDREQVLVTVIKGFLHCSSLIDIEQEKQKQNQDRLEKEAKHLLSRAELAQACEDFNRSLNLPFRWIPGIKDVLSGLSENSNGDGVNSRTVNHILLLEDISIGKLERKEGEFLCSTKRHKNWSGQIETKGKVTCKACLKLSNFNS